MRKFFIFALSSILLLSSCSIPGRTARPATPSPSTQEQTPLLPPGPAQEGTPLPEVSKSAEPGSQREILLFFIALDDNGKSGTKIGCNDSIVPVTIKAGSTPEVLQYALQTLLDHKEQYYGQSGLYNVFFRSDLKVKSLSVENEEALVYLEGTLSLGGVCDIPRVQSQLEKTALQFSTVKKAKFFINNIPLEEVLSQKD